MVNLDCPIVWFRRTFPLFGRPAATTEVRRRDAAQMNFVTLKVQRDGFPMAVRGHGRYDIFKHGTLR